MWFRRSPVRAGDAAHRQPVERARRRRQRLAVPRHQRGPLLAAVEPPDPGRAALRDRPPPGEASAAGRSRVPSSSGGSTRGPRSTSASRPSRTTGSTATRRSASPARPDGYTDELEARLGPFPFHTFWGPMAGLPLHRSGSPAAPPRCVTRRAARPDARLPAAPRLRPAAVRPGRLRHAEAGQGTRRRLCARCSTPRPQLGARVWVVSEYGHCDVSRPVYLNRALRNAGLLEVRRGPFGEQLDPYLSRAFAVCDHQLAHVYVRDPRRRAPRPRRAGRRCRAWPASSPARSAAEVGLRHDRAGELVVLSEPRRLVRLPVLARRPARPGLRPDGGHPPQARLRPVRAVLRPEALVPEAPGRPGGSCRRSSASA